MASRGARSPQSGGERKSPTPVLANGCRVEPAVCTMKTIEVNQQELVKYIVSNCPHYFYNFADGESCYGKVTKETCKLHVFADDLHCPHDCPRLNTKEYACDKGRCPKVRATIKKLKA